MNAIVIVPSVVSSTARCCASCSGVSFANGTGSGGGVSRIVIAVIATRVSGAPFASAGSSEIFCDDVEPFADAAEHGELPRQRRLFGDAHEELRAAAVRLPRPQRRAHRAARERLRAVFRLQHAEPARSRPAPLLRRILRQRIAPLDDPVPHDAMERRVRVRPLARQLHEVADVVRRQVRPQIDDERARGGLDHRLLARHLRGVSGVLNGAGRRRRPARACDGRAAVSADEESCRQ